MTSWLRKAGAMRRSASTVLASIGLATVSLIMPASADADPVGDPCSLAIVLFYRLLPIAPDLDHDVDLTTQYPATDPGDPGPESLPPADICPRGCS
jgi:hypothetical protein